MIDKANMPMPVIPKNIGKPGGPRFLDVLNYHINFKLQNFVGQSLNRETMENMYDCVAETVHGVFTPSTRPIHEDARCWLAQKMYESVKVGDSPIITRDSETWKHDVHPVYMKCDLKNVPDSDLRYIAGLFNEASFAPLILDELKSRNIR
jgi:hypothetical protein